MKYITRRFLFMIFVVFVTVSCSKSADTQDINDAVQATVIAHAVASTLTAQPPLSTFETPITMLLPTSTPMPEHTPTSTLTPTPSPVPTITSTPEPIRVIRNADVIFELDSCVMQIGTVVCSFWITNIADDRDMQLCGGTCNTHTTMYDNFGNEYTSDIITLANQQGTYISVFLVSNTKMRGSVFFNDVSDQASRIALLSIHGSLLDEGGIFDIEFRDIPLISQ